MQVTVVDFEHAVKNAQYMAEGTREPSHRDNIILVMNDYRGYITYLIKRYLNVIFCDFSAVQGSKQKSDGQVSDSIMYFIVSNTPK